MNNEQVKQDMPLPEALNLQLVDAKPHTLATPEETNQMAADIQAGKNFNSIELGQLRRKFFTREFPRVKACGHKFIPNAPPHDKCQTCWQTYFTTTNGLLVKALQIVSEDVVKGREQLTNTFGTKWVKALDRFVAATLAAKTAEVVTDGEQQRAA
jgi:hypothetical protein